MNLWPPHTLHTSSEELCRVSVWVCGVDECVLGVDECVWGVDECVCVGGGGDAHESIRSMK